jgi:hypothetical protein
MLYATLSGNSLATFLNLLTRRLRKIGFVSA